jgi:hypothetical protein
VSFLEHNCIEKMTPSCPQCARFREKMDREKMAQLLSDTAPWAASWDEFDHWAGALIAYLTE